MANETQPPSLPDDAQRPAITDYDLLRIIGRGSYGDVWLARGVTGAFRAVKVVWRHRFNDPHPFEREFNGLREFTAISLVEAHQLALLHVGRNDAAGFFYYVMELADDAETGREIDPQKYVPLTLREMRSRRGQLSTGQCIVLGAEVARALAVLHSRKLVHRDIKPSNIVIVGGVAKLADIGLVASATDARTFVGTEGFIPPEGPGEPTADVYGLGKLIYELSSGRDRKDFPRLPENFATLADRKVYLELNEIVIRACDPLPSRRYPDAAAMLEDLLLLQAGRSVRRLRFVERRLRDSLRLIAVLVGVAGVAAGGAYVERARLAAETGRRQQAEAALEALEHKAFYAETISRAEGDLEKGNYGIARTILESAKPAPGQPDLRSFEWQALWKEAQGNPATVLSESGPALSRVNFSPDGSLLASQSISGEITVWQPQTGQRIRNVKMPHSAYFAGFSGDGRWLLGVNERYALERWSLAAGTPEGTANAEVNSPLSPLGADRVVSYVFSGDGRAHRIAVWDFATRSEVVSVPIPHTAGRSGSYYTAAVSPDGARCAVSLIIGKAPFAQWRLVVLDLKSGRTLWDEALSGRLAALSFGTDGHTLACALADPDEVRLLDLERGVWGWRTSLSGAPSAVRYVEPGEFCVGGRGRGLQLIAADSGRTLRVLVGQAGSISDLASDRNTGQVASASDAGELRVWAQSTHPWQTQFTGFWRAPGRQLCLSRDGQLLAGTFDGRSVRVVDTRDAGGAPRDIEGVLSPIVFTPEGGLWLLGLDGSVQEWRVLPIPKQIASVRVAALGAPLAVARGSADTQWIVVSDASGRLTAVDTVKGAVRASATSDPNGVFWVAVSGNGRRVAASGPRQEVGLWSLPDLNRIGLWHCDQRVTNGEFSPDGGVLALTLKSGSLQFHKTRNLALMESRTTASGTAYGLSFHPTEPRLFVGGQDGVLHVFATSDWSEILQMNAAEPGTNPGTIITEAASADGSTLAAYTESGLIRLWRR